MKTSFLLALSGLGWAVLAQVHIPFTRPSAREHDSRASRRDDKLNVDLYGAKFTYMLNATVGTPPQDVSMILSCGSYVTWVPDGQSSTCKSRRTTSSGSSSSSSSSSSPSSSSSSTPRYCIWGSYNKSASTTSATDPDGNTFTARYVDGSYASGKRVLDTMSINGVAATDMPIGVASSMDDYIGVLGIGYNDTTRDNYPDRLVAAGAIKTSAYSIWLNDPEAKSGNVLFGAVDTSKFDGNMTRIYASKTTSVWYTFGTYLNTVNGTNSTVDHKVINSTTMPAPVFISPSDSISNLPDSIASQIWEMANATWNPSYKLATVPCSANTSNASFSFELSGAGGPVINVPMVDLVISEDIWSTSTWSWDTKSATKYCMFGIQNGTLGSGRNYYSTGKEEQGAWNIGSPLLRRTYTAFDLVNRQVAFAPVKFGVSEQKIVSFDSYGSKMPQTTFFCGPQDYCYGEGSSRDRGSSSGRGGSGSGGRYYDEGLSPAGVLGVSIGIGMAFLLIMLGVVWWCLRGGRQCCGERTKEPESEAEAEAAAASAQPAMAENSAPAAAPATSPVPTATAEPAPTQPSTSPASHEIPPVTPAPNGEGSSRQPQQYNV